MVVDTSLTESMLLRLSKIDDQYKEDGDPNDPTRLVKAWGGAPKDEKRELERIVLDAHENKMKLTATIIREDYPKFRIYTTAAVQCAIGNARKKIRKDTESRSKSKLFAYCYLIIFFNSHSHHICSSEKGEGRRPRIGSEEQLSLCRDKTVQEVFQIREEYEEEGTTSCATSWPVSEYRNNVQVRCHCQDIEDIKDHNRPFFVW